MTSLLKRRIAQARSLGPRTAMRLAISRGARIARAQFESARALVLPTGMNSWRHEKSPRRILPALRIHSSSSLDCFERGKFDLLGSGLIGIERTFDFQKLPKPWRVRADELGGFAVATVAPIDWQLDPTSGYRWNAKTRSSRISYGSEPLVEVKWPWEIGRLQHLPAIAARIEGADLAWQERATDVIRGNIIDFVRSNPPGFGVQWLCPMDVGIRIVNILVAVDLARAAGEHFTSDFLKIVACTGRDHARHIARNLEWGERLCSNHYLANIAGLLYVGAYLQDDVEGADWLAFAGREMVQQIRSQFHEEGSNFEASTCYHRLSAEMAIHSVALMLYISRHQPERAARWWSGPVRRFHPSPVAPPTPRMKWTNGLDHPIDEDLQRRLWGMGKFTESLLRKDGSIPQIGDNDSGRFMRLELSDRPYADIDDYRHLVHASRALFGMSDGIRGRESDWLSRWLGDAVLPKPVNHTNGHWAQFGLFTWRRPAYHLTFRCGHVGQLGNGGHAHCDQLSITLATADGSVIDDPGTGVYTPDPKLRNQLRSSSCHSTVLVPDQEQGEWLPDRWGLFAMRDRARARMVSHDQFGGSAEMFQGKALVRRRLELAEHSVRILDMAPEGSVANFILGPQVVVESLSEKMAMLRLGPKLIRLCGKALRLEECPWSARYNCISSTKKIRCAAGECEIQFE